MEEAMLTGSQAARVLVVEDEAVLRLAIGDALEAAGHRVETAADGRSGLAMALGRDFDAVVLDLMLPGLDGMDVCRSLRAAGKRVPLLMLTARGSEQDRIHGLQCGADDYLPKPFSVREMLARVGALLRRAQWDREPPGTQLRHGPVTVDLDRLEATCGARREALTQKEGEILRFLARRQGVVASKRELLTGVWGYPEVELETRTVENTLGVLRRKLEGLDGAACFIVTVRGLGFRLAPEVELQAEVGSTKR